MPNFNSVFDTVDISTRPKRRRAVLLIITALSRIRSAETAYMERIPANLTDSEAYSAADESIYLLSDAIELLTDVY